GCQNTMTQLGCGLQNHHDVRKSLPVGVHSGVLGNIRLGTLTQLLPYVNQQNLARSYDYNSQWFDLVNLPVTQVPLKVYACPSATKNRPDGRPEAAPVTGSQANPAIIFPNQSLSNSPTVSVAPADSGPTTQVGARLAAAYPGIVAGPGVMPKNSKPTLADVTDGTSNTIAMAESAGRPQVWRLNVPFGSPPNERVNGGGW